MIPDYTLIYEENEKIKKALSTALENIVLKPTIYDELEFFEKSGEYPFSKRQNPLPAVMMKNNDTYSKTHKVLLRKNSVCYDKDIFG